MKNNDVGRPIKIDGMAYGPTNEYGVVLLFGCLAAQLGFHVEFVQQGFPDCIARRRGESCRIEFEYRASSYGVQEHPPHGADIIVCWENDWERRASRYKHLEIIDLKKHVGVRPRVFFVGYNQHLGVDDPAKYQKVRWSLPSLAQVDDLVLIYRSAPVSAICDIWRVVGPWIEDKKWGLEAGLELVTLLDKPLKYHDLKNDAVMRNLNVVRKRFQGKGDLADDWLMLSRQILKLNPKARTAHRPYLPH